MMRPVLIAGVLLAIIQAAPCLGDSCEQSEGKLSKMVRVQTATGVTGVGCVLVDDLLIAEGDIIISTASTLKGVLNPLGIGVPLETRLWPNKIVPFELEYPLDNDQRISDAMKEWKKAGVSFVPRSSEADWVVFRQHNNCTASFVGRQGGKQFVLIAPKCSTGNVIHEIGHVLALWHEQAREDRDKHIEILWDNIEKDKQGNFTNILHGKDIDNYDFGSIMHYATNDFAINPNLPTIRPLEPTTAFIGQRRALSGGDVSAVEKLYEGRSWGGSVSRPPPSSSKPILKYSKATSTWPVNRLSQWGEDQTIPPPEKLPRKQGSRPVVVNGVSIYQLNSFPAKLYRIRGFIDGEVEFPSPAQLSVSQERQIRQAMETEARRVLAEECKGISARTLVIDIQSFDIAQPKSRLVLGAWVIDEL